MEDFLEFTAYFHERKNHYFLRGLYSWLFFDIFLWEKYSLYPVASSANESSFKFLSFFAFVIKHLHPELLFLFQSWINFAWLIESGTRVQSKNKSPHQKHKKTASTGLWKMRLHVASLFPKSSMLIHQCWSLRCHRSY